MIRRLNKNQPHPNILPATMSSKFSPTSFTSHFSELLANSGLSVGQRQAVEMALQSLANQTAPSAELVKKFSTQLAAGIQFREIAATVSQLEDFAWQALAAVQLETYLSAVSESGCSPSTIKNYRSDINQFLTFSNCNEVSAAFTKPKVTAFVLNQQVKNLKASSIVRKLSSLSQFGAWLFNQGLLTANPDWISSISPTVSPVTPGLRDYKAEQPVREPVKPINFDPISVTKTGPRHTVTTQKARNQTFLQVPFAKPGATKSAGIGSFFKHRLHSFVLPYLNFALLILFFLGLGFFGYRQFIVDAPSKLAYPSSPVSPSRVLSFQGRLTDTAQNPITTATNMRFYLYDSGPSIVGGTQLWDSTTCSVTPDQDGIFSVGLGSDCGSEIAASVFSEDASVWLQVEIASETLSPRQALRSVAYAINSETLQGFPISASESATINTVLVMNEWGQVVLGENSPTLKAVSGTFAVEGQTLQLQTTSGSNGNIILDPDGTGGVNILSNATLTGYLRAPGATLSATYAGGVPLTVQGGPSGTANIQNWQNAAGSTLAYIDASGNIVTAGNLGIAADTDLLSLASNALTVNGTVTATGTVNSSGGTLQTNGTDRISNGGNLVNIGTTQLNSVTYTWPGADGSSGYALTTNGSGTLSWAAASGLGTNYWRLMNGAFSPVNDTADLLIGGIATASAKFAVLNVNTGTPVASISANSGNIATYLTGDGSLATTNRNNLTIGNSSTYDTTGNVLINPNGTGRVGIGTTSPLTNFQVNGKSFFSQTVNIDYGHDLLGSNSDGGLVFRNSSGFTGAANAWMGTYFNSDGVKLAVSSDADRAFIITDYANTGIQHDVTLQTNPTLYLFSATSPDTNNTQWLSLTHDQTNGVITSGTGNIILSPASNVGIGTTNPGAKLDVAGSASLSGTLAFRGTTDPKIDILNGENFGIRTSPGGDAGLAEKLTVLGSGRVGIGQTTPITKLHVTANVGSDFNQASGAAILSGLDYTVGGIAGHRGIFPLDTGFRAGIVGLGDQINTIDILPISSYGSVGVVGSSGLSSGGRTNIGVFGQAYFNQAFSGNSGNSGRAGQFLARLTNVVTDFNGTLYGTYNVGDSRGGTSTGGSVFGSYNEGFGETNNTVYGGYFTASGGTTNYALYTNQGENSFGNNLTLRAQSDLRLADSDSSNYIALQSPAVVGSDLTYTLPGTVTNGYVLQTDGSGVMTWADPTTLAGAATYWNQANGALFAKNSTVDFLVGGQSTASAKFAVLNVNTGTPVASISANSGNIATYITGDGSLSTTNRNNLTIGNSSTYNTTGNVLINPNGTGFVGVGTTTPITALDVNGRLTFESDTGTQLYRVADDNIRATGSFSALTQVLSPLFKNLAGSVTIAHEAGGNVYLGSTSTSSTQATNLILNPSGNVGIGSLTPGAKLDINGNLFAPIATFSANYAGGVPLTVKGGPSGTANIFRAESNNGNRFVSIDSTGALDVNTVSPETTARISSTTSNTNTTMGGSNGQLTLALRNRDTTTNNRTDIGFFGSGGGTLAALIGVTNIDTTNSYGVLNFATRGAGGFGERMRIDSTGNVGIGDTSPDAKLNILATTEQLRLDYDDSNYASFFTQADGELQLSTTGTDPDITLNPGTGGSLIFADLNCSGNTNGGALTADASGVISCTDDDSAAGGTSYWRQANGAISPINDTNDVLIGSAATTSAKFAFLNVNTGTPIATISANSGNIATYITGDGTLATTNRQSLTIGNSTTYNTTGNVLINPNGTGYVGIGTTTPSRTLSVSGTAEFLGTRNIYLNTTTNYGVRIKGSAGGWTTAYGFQGTADTQLGGFGAFGSDDTLTRYFIGTFSTDEKVSIVSSTGNVGINDTTPDAKLNILATTEQLRLDYDDSNYASFFTQADGELQLSTTGTDPDITLNPGTGGSLIFADLNCSGNTNGGALTADASGVVSCTDDDTGAGGTSYWRQANGAISPINDTNDVLIGSTATTSAKFAFLNVNTGTPVASISANSGNIATYLTGDGSLATTNRNNLTIGNSSTYNTTGNVLINPNGTGNVGIGTTSPTLGKLQVRGTLGDTYVSSAGTQIYVSRDTFATIELEAAGTGLVGTSSNHGLSLQTNSVEHVRIDTSGLVGIGTTTPTSKLHVSGAVTGKALVALNETGNQDIFTASASGTTRLVISNAGNVGVGTTNPGAKLDVVGDLFAPTATFSANYAGGIALTAKGGPSGTANIFNIQDSSSNTLAFFDSAGNFTLNAQNDLRLADADSSNYIALQSPAVVGSNITYTLPGTVTNGYILQTDGSGTLTWIDTASTGVWRASSGAVSPINDTFDLLVGSAATTSAKFAVLNVNTGTPVASISANSGNIATYITGDGSLSTTNRNNLTIGNSSTYDTTGNVLINPNGTGNVGIGTTNPGAKLEISGGNIALGNNQYIQWRDIASGTLQNILRYSNSDAVTINSPTTATVGSGALTLQGNNNTALQTAAGRLELKATQVNSSAYIALTTGASERMRITNDGNVGIGLTTPGAKLDINGDLFAPTATFSANYAGGVPLSIKGGPSGTANIFNIQNSSSTNLAYFDSSGNLTLNAQNTVRLADADSSNYIALQSPAVVGSNITYTLPGTVTNGYYLQTDGSGTLTWAAVSGASNWQLNSGALSPFSLTADINLGATASSSAKISLAGSLTRGKALAIFNQTEDQDILAASASGTTRFRLDQNGYVHAQRFVDIANSSYYLDPAATDTSLTVVGKTGLGTATPVHQLQVTGSVVGKALTVLNETGTNDILTASNSGITKMTIDNNGNIGVGNVDPVGRVDVALNFTYERALTVTNSGSALYNSDVLIEVDTSSLISGSKMNSDCSDIRLTTSNKQTQLTHWIESGCNTTTTQIWVRVPTIANGSNTLYLFYGNTNAQTKQTSWESSSVNAIFPFEASCPAGWTAVSALNSTNSFPRGNTSYGATGGSTTHDHTYTIVTDTSGASANRDTSASNNSASRTTHTHTITGTSTTASNLPPYKDVIYCSYDTAGIPNTVTTDVLGFFEATPSAWTIDNSYNDFYLRGNTTAGGSGGATTHTHDISGTTNTPSASFSIASGADTRASSTHTHTYNITSDSSSTLSPYYDLIIAQPGATATLPEGSIVMFDATSVPPIGWSRFSGLDNRFVRGAPTSGGTGGSDSHANTVTSSVDTHSGNVTSGGGSGGGATVMKNHAHGVSGALDSSSNLPPYLDVVFYKKNIDNVSVSNGSEVTSNHGLIESTVSQTGKLGIGTNSATWKLTVEDVSATASAMIANRNNLASSNAVGLQILLGLDSSTNPDTEDRFINFMKGDSTIIGKIQGNGSGGITYATAGVDFAEYFKKSNPDEPMVPGDVICHGDGGVTKCSTHYTELLGIISDQAGFVGGSSREGDPNYALVGLVGQLRATVSSESGYIAHGTPLNRGTQVGTVSNSLQSGQILGHAISTYDPNNPGDGKVLVSIHVSYATAKGLLHLGKETLSDATSGITATTYSLFNELGVAINSIASYSSAVIANLTAGRITTTELIANQTTSTTLSTDLISPLASGSGDLVIDLERTVTSPQQNSSNTSSELGTLLLKGNLEVTGDATIAGTLTTDTLDTQSISAQTAYFDQVITASLSAGTITGLDAAIEQQLATRSSRLALLENRVAEFEQLKVQTASIANATISGTLFAENIDGFKDKVASALAEPSLLAKLLSTSSQTASSAATLPNLTPTTATTSAKLKLADLNLSSTDLVLTAEAGFINQYFEVNGNAFIGNSLEVTGHTQLGATLNVGNSLTINSTLTVTGNSISADLAKLPNHTFYIQPEGHGQLSLLNNLVVLDSAGTVDIAGSLTIAGNVRVGKSLLTNLITPTEFGQPLQVQLASKSAEAAETTESRFEIINELGTPVATISGQGRASFAGGLGIGAETLAASDQPVETSQTSGKAVLKAATNEVIIKATKLTANSLIYVTPQGTTNNQVMYVKAQQADNPATPENEAQFVVGLDQALQQDVLFNWWIVN